MTVLGFLCIVFLIIAGCGFYYATQETIEKSVQAYKDQIASLTELNETNKKVIQVKSLAIQDLDEQLQSKNSQIAQLKQLGTKQSFADNKIVNNTLTFNYLIKKKEIKDLSHDVQLYVKENQQLEQTVKGLVQKCFTLRSQMEQFVSAGRVFELQWLVTLERIRNETIQLKKTLLKNHIAFTSEMNKEQLAQTTKQFMKSQLDFNNQIDKKEQELVSLRKVFMSKMKVTGDKLDQLIQDSNEVKYIGIGA